MPDILDMPTQDTMPPLRLNLPTEGELSPSEINSLISTATTMRKMDLESKAAARRYRGQQQLQALIAQGVPFDQALLRVSGDLMYQDPHGFASIIRQQEINQRAIAREADYNRRWQQQIEEQKRYHDMLNAARAESNALKRTPEQIEEAERNRMDYGIFKQSHMKALQNKAIADKALKTFQGNAMTQAMKMSKDPGIEAQEEEKRKALQDAQDELDAIEQQGVKLGHLKPRGGATAGPATAQEIEQERQQAMSAMTTAKSDRTKQLIRDAYKKATGQDL